MIYRKVTTVHGTENFIPDGRAQELAAADKKDKAAIAEAIAGGASAGAKSTLERMDIKDLDLDTAYFAHRIKGANASIVEEYSTEEPVEDEAPAAPAATGLQASDVAAIVSATIAAMQPAAPTEPKAKPGRKPKEEKAEAVNEGDSEGNQADANTAADQNEGDAGSQENQ